MLIYNSIIFIMIVSFFSIEKEYFKNLCYPVLLLFFLYFPFVVGINSARADYDAYVSYFDRLPTLFSENYFEKLNYYRTELGYGILTGFIKLFTNSPTIFFILFCFLSLVFRFYAVKYFVRKEDIILVLFAFLAHEFLRKDAVQIRNGFASSVVIFSFISLYKGQKLRFCLWIIVASMFHTVSLIALPLAVISPNIDKKKLKIMKYIFFIAIISTFFFSIKEVLYIFERFGIVPTRVVNYLHWSRYSKAMSIYHPVVLKQIMICLFFLFFRRNILLSSNRVATFLFQVYFVSTLYYLVFLDFEILAGRFGSLFSGVEAIFLLQVIYDNNVVKQKKTWKLGVYAIICLSFIINMFTYTSMLSFEATFQ